MGEYFYEGEWREDKKDGQGKERWEDGSWYKGQFKKDNKEG